MNDNNFSINYKATHPEYLQKINELEVMFDTYEGSDYIKSKGDKYLPPLVWHRHEGYGTSGTDGHIGYLDYKNRAVFHDLVKEGVNHLLGMLHQKPPIINLPKKLEYLRDHASNFGESLEALLRRINEQQLLYGRVGLLIDVATTSILKDKPYISLYSAMSITNWNVDVLQNGYTTVVLNESGAKFNPQTLNWDNVEKYRLLTLSDNCYMQKVFTNESESSKEIEIKPCVKGQTLNMIPFVIANATDTTSILRTPPLKGLADLTLSIYKSEADYRQNLHQQGQDTLVLIGANLQKNEKVRVGANASICLDVTGDAKYIGVSANGLAAQASAIEKDLIDATQKAGQFEKGGSARESGEAMRTRIASRTATLNDIASAGAEALELAIKYCGKWLGLSTDELEEINVFPNRDFTNSQFNMQNLIQLVTSRNQGAPIALETIHSYLKDNGLTVLTFADELRKIEEDDSFNVRPISRLNIEELEQQLLELDNKTKTSTSNNSIKLRQTNESTVSLTNDPTKLESAKDKRQ